VREVVHEFGADLAESTDLRKVAEDEPRAAITIRCRHDGDMTSLVRVAEPTVANVNLTSVHLACDRLAGKLLKSEVNGRFNQRHAAELHITARQNLARYRARSANDEVGSDAKDGVIGCLKESVEALRSAIGAIPRNVGSAALTRCAIGLCCYILCSEAANYEVGNPC
jgi:hypothetical protein